MGRSFLVLAAAVLLCAPPALGQYEAVITACRWDAKGICAAALPADGRLADCIKTNFQALSEPCKAALVRIAGVREACGADVKARCGATRPGPGRILLCVKANYAALSEPCKSAIGHAAERKLRAH